MVSLPESKGLKLSGMALQLLAVAVVAFLYSAVGHGGATGYLAALALLGRPQDEMASTALVLNLAVAGLAFNAYRLKGEYRPELIWPFLIASVPAAFVGARLPVDRATFEHVLAGALLLAALRFLFLPASSGLQLDVSAPVASPTSSWPRALTIGATLGLLSGVTGIGGGVFLSPVLILARLATVKQTACASALFILANSTSGLAGRYLNGHLCLDNVWVLLGAAVPAALAGSSLGAGRFSSTLLNRILSVVLLIAATKLLI